MTESSILSNKQLVIGFILALFIGGALTYFVILPAEQGEDPSGFGETTGLTQLTDGGIEETVAPVLELDEEVLYISVDPNTADVPFDDFGRPLPSLTGTNQRLHDARYKSEKVEITLPVDAQIEFKAIMEEGDVLLYSWEADSELYFDFHAHDETANPDFWTRYTEGEGTSESGSIVAPYSGQHGWYWLNLNDGDTTVTLTVAGYYDELIEIDLSGY